MYKQSNWVYGPTDILVSPHLNYGQFILDKFWTFRNKELINAITEEHLTFGQIIQLAMNMSISLGRIGVRKGQVVAICSENRMEYFPTVIGVVCTGAVLTTVNVGYTKDELTHIMNISKPKYVVCSPSYYEKYEKVLRTFNFVRKFIVFGDEKYPNTYLYNDLVTPGTELNIRGKPLVVLRENVKFQEFQAVDVQGQTDTVFILYSSGTTGLPKGVMLTHYNLIFTGNLPTSRVPIEYTLTITPWYHVMGLVGTLSSLSSGRSQVFLPKFDVEIYMKTIEKYRITQITVVPPVLLAICKSELNYDLSSVDVIYSAAAPLHKDALDVVKNKFPSVKAILQGYGMTESTLAICKDMYGGPDMTHKSGGVGYVVAYSVVKVADLETGASLGSNQRGEIRIKSPMIMKGYVGKDLRDDLDEDGFFKTGDIGYYDDDRYFYIVDRLKELIKYKAYQVPPAEIEAVLLQHPAVRDAAVVGVDHRTAGEVPLAFVVKQPGAEVTEEQIKQFVAEKLSNPKHLRGGVRFVAEIPKNPSGKILRKTLREMARGGTCKL